MKKVLFFWFTVFICFQTNAQEKRPNIILFLVDDMGWQDCSLPFWDKPTKLNATYHTPNMERLAAKGMMLTNAYSNAVCTPTRVSLMTGMNVARHGVTNWTNVNSNTPTDFKDSLLQPATWNYNGLTPELHYSTTLQHTVVATPLPQILKEAGYYTIHAGKAHFASTGMPGASPINMGFDVNIGGSAAGHPGSFLASKNYRQNERDTSWAVRGLEKYIPEDLYLTEAITRETIHTLDARVSNKPFFLYLSHYAVHVPYDKDIRFYQKYMDAGLTDTEAKYAALVEGMDKSLGDMMNYLEKEKPFLKTEFSLHDLSRELNIPHLRVSGFFNKQLKNPFPEFKKRLRVGHAIQLFKENMHLQMSIEGIATVCGFKNKSRFYAAFKAEYKMTPTEWIEKNK